MHLPPKVKPSALLFLLLLAVPAVGQVLVPAKEVAGASEYGPKAVQFSSHALQGKLIKLQFVCRSSIFDKTADGGVTGEVVDSPGTRIRIDVQVPKQAVAWFMSVPTTYAGGPPFSIYARLSVDKFGAPVAILLGRQLHPDPGGSRIDW